MLYVLLLLIVVAGVFGPSLWVQNIMRRYSRPDDRYLGTGGELARQLLDGIGLGHIDVEQTNDGDHYDPRDKKVRLMEGNFKGRSLTAVTIAAHEVGHAMQDHQGYAPLRVRTALVGMTRHFERIGALTLMAAPVIGLITRAPSVGLLMIIGGLLSIGTSALVHLVTLPTELDASFGRALPLLEDRDILIPGDLPHARRLLKAASLTYISASLLSLLNVARWWAILRK